VNIPDKPGSYVIVGELLNEVSIISGTFSGQILAGGFYLYAGSAFGPGGLKARIGRHLKSETKKFWHFDHLKDFLKIREIWYSLSGEKNFECYFIRKLQAQGSASFPILKFGSSDCRSACPAHLVKFSFDTDMGIIFSYLESQDFTLQKHSLV
jgi:Uri superfamily endonuclease